MDANEPIPTLNAEAIEMLVREVQAGHVESYRTLVQHCQRRLHLYCFHMIGSREEAEDTVQEVFLKAYREIGKYRPTVSFASWLYKIAYRHCLNALRHRQGQQRLLSLLKLQWPSAAPPRSLSAAYALLDGLSVEERQLVILRTLEERSFEEIAEISGSNAAALRKKFERIRKKLNQRSIREEILDDRPTLFTRL